ncbi:50S ribosomal protein L3 N(5)-glutamine methyltransferase [Pseudomonadales bacterium]|nr:50S ribosomal protein L3 N(5)-glutamine methyltransferase [Pseudomonadales bacterium]
MQNHDEITSQLTTIRDYARWSMGRFTESNIFYGHGTDNAWDESLTLIFHLLHLPPEANQHVLDAVLTKAERQLILRVVETRCLDRMPLPYLTNEAWFTGMPFIVDERVLIPRSPIGELIEAGFFPWAPQTISKVLDMCTGSGCIGLACVNHLEVEADLVDLSRDALAVAAKNIAKHGMSESARIIQSDLFAEVNDHYDIIVTNPPYVDAADLDAMPPEFHHEPRVALAAGDDGLDLAHKILAEASRYLTEQGILVMEVGNSWVALEQAYPSVPFTWIEFERGGHGVCVFNRLELVQYFS